MHRKNLEQLKDMREELETLRRKYLALPISEDVGDTYGDYRSGHKHTKVMYGTSTVKSDRLQAKIAMKRDKLEKEILKLEDYLDSIEDSQMRDIIRLYYAEGLSQEEIGKQKGYDRSTISKKIESFWHSE